MLSLRAPACGELHDRRTGLRSTLNRYPAEASSSRRGSRREIQRPDERPGERLELSRRQLLGAAASTSAAGISNLVVPGRSDAFIQLPSRLHNRYILVRHGESVLEERNLILTNPAFKYDFTWGLTDRGQQQMAEVGRAISANEDLSPSWIYTSNFQRAYQSALILRDELGILYGNCRFEFSGLLDPRKMGALDGAARGAGQSALLPVWDGDARDPASTPPPVPSMQPSASVESVNDVYRRALEAFTRLEAAYFGADIVLVSHEDTLSIFTAALLGTELGRHHIDHPYELGQYRVVDQTQPPKEGELYDPRARTLLAYHTHPGLQLTDADLRGNLAPQDDRGRYNFTSNGLLLREGDEEGA